MALTRSRRPRVLAALGAGTLVLLAAACSAPASAPAGKGSSPGEVKIATSEWKFEPATVKVPAGQPVTVVLENKGAIEHDLKVEALGFQLQAQPKQNARQTLTFDRPGTYDVECSIPGHKEAGMKAKLVVGG